MRTTCRVPGWEPQGSPGGCRNLPPDAIRRTNDSNLPAPDLRGGVAWKISWEFHLKIASNYFRFENSCVNPRLKFRFVLNWNPNKTRFLNRVENGRTEVSLGRIDRSVSFDCKKYFSPFECCQLEPMPPSFQEMEDYHRK